MTIKDLSIWMSCLVIALAVLLLHFWSGINASIRGIQDANRDLALIREIGDDYRQKIEQQSARATQFLGTGNRRLLNELSELRTSFDWTGDTWIDAAAVKGVAPSLLARAALLDLDPKQTARLQTALDKAHTLFKAQNDQILERMQSVGASRWLSSYALTLETAAETAIGSFVQAAEQDAARILNRAHGQIAQARPIMAGLFVTLFFSLFATAAFFRAKIWNGFISIREAVNEMAEREESRTVLGIGRDDEVGELARAIAKLREKMQIRLDRLRYLAFHDPLTGLENRARLRDQLTEMLRARRSDTSAISVFVIDLDKFKEVNDVYGHLIGDEILKETATRLRQCAPAGSIVARFGGDEFAILSRLQTKKMSAEDHGHEIAARLTAPIAISAGIWVSCAGSVGVAVAGRADVDADEMIAKADAALYAAKAKRRGTCCLYIDGMDAEMRRRRSLQDDLASAISADQLRLAYQPQFSAVTHELTGFEALLRWSHPELGEISPADFIPAAEDVPLIITVGRWSIERAVGFAASWSSPLRISVNLSPGQFYDHELVEFIQTTLASHNLPPDRLEIEVTETLFIENIESATEILGKMRALGISVALDDFGTGFSALSYLRTLPADRIKIDKSFVDPVSDNAQARAIVKSIIMIARAVEMDVIAEGVETENQRTVLEAEGCDEIQGYLAGRPLTQDQALDLIGSRTQQALVAFKEDTAAEAESTRLDPRRNDVA